MTEAVTLLGRVVEVDVGPVAHGGHCVARLVARVGDEHGRVVFVRHALPGERVRVKITEDTGKAYCRGDAVEVLQASPHRVEPPCVYARPGRCGGCDWQHAEPAYQRRLKADVVSEQLQRLGGLSRDVDVEELPGGALGWRTRIQYSVDAGGAVGLHRHRSFDVERIDRCLIGAPGVGDAPELAQLWPGASGLDVAVAEGGQRSVVLSTPIAAPATRPGRSERRGHHPADLHRDRQRHRQQHRQRSRERHEQVSGPVTLAHTVDDLRFDVAAAGFWQVHPAAAGTLTAVVRDFAGVRAGDTCLDLYAGAGLFAAALAELSGSTGRVVGVESNARAVADAVGNLAQWPQAEVLHRQVTAATVQEVGAVDVVVLDPPRSGAGRDVLSAVLATGARTVVYVACDPAALARDLRTATELGWRLTGLRAFDLFPMTQHVECVARLEPASASGDDARPSESRG